MQENNLSSLENTKIEQADTPSLNFIFSKWTDPKL